MGTINTHSEGASVIVEVKINETNFVMENVYALVNDKAKFFDSLFTAIADFIHNDLILARLEFSV